MVPSAEALGYSRLRLRRRVLKAEEAQSNEEDSSSPTQPNNALEWGTGPRVHYNAADASCSFVALISVLTISAECADKGFCPPLAPFPKLQKPYEPPPRPDQTYVGTVSLAAVVSDKGYVCNARVLQGIDKKTNAEALAMVKAWRFDPARKDGRAVPASIQVDVTYWKNKNGEIVSSPSSPQKTQNIE